MKYNWVTTCLLIILAATGGSKLLGQNFRTWLAVKRGTQQTVSATTSSADIRKLPKTDSCFKSGKHYAILPNAATIKPQLVEFFSFYCTQCYAFQHKHHISDALADSIPPGGTFKQYHVPILLGPLAKELTRAWIIAGLLGIEKKMSPILFDGVQKYSTINKPEDIRQAFLDAGVTAQEYDNSLNSFLVNSLIAQQSQLLKEAKIYGVPSLLVNKKYRIHPENFSTKHGIQGFTQQYLQLTKQLLVAER